MFSRFVKSTFWYFLGLLEVIRIDLAFGATPWAEELCGLVGAGEVRRLQGVPPLTEGMACWAQPRGVVTGGRWVGGMVRFLFDLALRRSGHRRVLGGSGYVAVMALSDFQVFTSAKMYRTSSD